MATVTEAQQHRRDHAERGAGQQDRVHGQDQEDHHGHADPEQGGRAGQQAEHDGPPGPEPGREDAAEDAARDGAGTEDGEHDAHRRQGHAEVTGDLEQGVTGDAR